MNKSPDKKKLKPPPKVEVTHYDILDPSMTIKKLRSKVKPMKADEFMKLLQDASKFKRKKFFATLGLLKYKAGKDVRAVEINVTSTEASDNALIHSLVTKIRTGSTKK